VAEPLVQLDEARWVREAQRGDVDAFNRLVERYQTFVYNVAYRTLGQPEDAADATQEAFLSAYRHIRDFRGGSFKSWVARIVVNACLDARRTVRRRPATSMDAIVEELGEAPWADADAEDPERVALSHDTRVAIEAAMAELPAEQRVAVVLVDVQGLSYEEAADAMECALGTVRSRLARGRARLRELLLPDGNLS
jgi:RNA polymerase sigma-70 factor (ECF subfamily)